MKAAKPPARRSRGRGGKNGFEPRPRIRAREAEVWERAIAGETQREIGAALQLTQAGVSKILRRLEDQYAADHDHDMQRQRARQLARHGHVYRESMKGFQRSQTDLTRQRQTREGPEGVGADAGRSRSEIVVQRRDGNPAFLATGTQALKAVDHLGALARLPQPASVPSGRPLAGLTDAELQAEMVDIVKRTWTKEEILQLAQTDGWKPGF